MDELVHELLQQLPKNMAGFSENNMDTGQGFAAVQWMLEPELAGKRIPTFTGPLARALEASRLSFFSTDVVLAYVSRKFTRGETTHGVGTSFSWGGKRMETRLNTGTNHGGIETTFVCKHVAKFT